MNKKELQSFEGKHLLLKLIAISATSKKNWIKLQWYKSFCKNTGSLMNCNKQRSWYLQLKKGLLD